MPVISRAIPTLLRGISQSSDALKQPDHADIQDNADSNPVLGLTKRSGLQYLASLSSSTLGNVHIQTINRDVNERYVAVFSNGNVQVFDLNGTEITVNKPDGTTYLNTQTPRSVIKTVTIADFTFVVNTSITAGMDTVLSPYTQDVLNNQAVSLEHQAIIFINQATAKTTYSVTVDGVTVTDNTDGDSTLSTTTIATDLKTGLDSGLTGFTINQNGPVLWIRKNDGTNFAIDGNDTQGNTKMSIFKDSVQRFTDLPTVSPNGYVVEIKGDDDTDFDNYYVKFVTNNGGDFEEGQWEETVEAGIPFKFNYGTMPHVLVRQADNEFRFARVDGDTYGITKFQDNSGNTVTPQTGVNLVNGAYATYTSSSSNNIVTITKTSHGFNTGDLVSVIKIDGTLNSGQFIVEKIDNNNIQYITATNEGANTNANCTIGLGFSLPKWGERTVGDLVSAPNPSFIGNTINNVFFFRNRLGFLAGDNVILSRVSEFFNFFPETVVSVLDNEPIDVAASHTKVAILKSAVTMGERLILFSDQTQFVLTSSADNLTPKTANVIVVTEFESSAAAQPVGSGTSIYFLTQKGSFAGIREYIIQGESQIRDAANITIHVPRLIPSNIFKMAVSTNQDILVLLGSDNPNKLYVYRWLYGGEGQKALSSWFTYTINSNRSILNIDFIGTDLFAVIEEANKVTLEKIPFETEFTEPNATFEYHLDHKVTEATTGVSVAFSNGVTTFTVPYRLRANMNIVGRYLSSATNATYSSTTANNTITITKTNHGFITGDLVHVIKSSGSLVSGKFVVTRVDDNTLTYITASNEGANTNQNCTIGETSTYIDSNGTTRTLVAGSVIQTTNSTDGSTSTITATGDYRNSKFIIGEPYEMHYRFSKQRLTEQGAGSPEYVGGRLQLHHFYIKYEDAGFFKVEVTPENRSTSIYKFTGNILGTASSTIGQINLDTGTFRVPIMSKSDRVDIDVKNNTFLPTRLASAEYEGVFHMRSRRI